MSDVSKAGGAVPKIPIELTAARPSRAEGEITDVSHLELTLDGVSERGDKYVVRAKGPSGAYEWTAPRSHHVHVDFTEPRKLTPDRAGDFLDAQLVRLRVPDAASNSNLKLTRIECQGGRDVLHFTGNHVGLEIEVNASPTLGTLTAVDGARSKYAGLNLRGVDLTRRPPATLEFRAFPGTRWPAVGGLQVLNFAMGGLLMQDIRDAAEARETSSDGGPTNKVAVIEGGPLDRARREASGSSISPAHHQPVRLDSNAVVILSRAPDGVIEAIEGVSNPWGDDIARRP